MADIPTNETLIQANLVSIKNAQTTFHGTNSRYGTIRELVDAGLLVSDYRARNMNGYVLREHVGQDEYWVNADPLTPGVTGNRCFFVDDSGSIRAEEEQSADASSPLV